MAILRHATSKIRSAADLDGILTLGFRGEALAAISSVSDMRIMSKRREDPMGAMLEVQGGRILGVTEHGCRDGTTVVVEHLFSHVPARRKFLKRDVTESMAVCANVERVALSHPEIAVRLIVDGEVRLETAGDGQLQSAVYAVFGREFASKLLPLDGEYDGITVGGFIGRSDNVKANRNGQNFFINHRYVKSRTAQAALEQAYVSYLPQEKYPCCVMNIGLNPARVDVNVHPAKLEVKFSNEKPVFEAVYYSVRQALEQNTTRPTLPGGAFRSAFGTATGRLSEATQPIEIERPESLQKRQIRIGQDGTALRVEPAAPTQEHITAEEYVARYIQDTSQKKRKETSPALRTTHTPTGNDSSRDGQMAQAAAAVVAADPEEGAESGPDIPMEVYEAEAQRLAMGGDGSLPTQADEPVPLPPVIPSEDEVQTPVKAEAPAEGTAGTGTPDGERTGAPTSGGEMAPPPPAAGTPAPDRAPVPDKEPEAGGDDPYRIIGEAFHAYILVEQGDRLLVIDKHAAHERIIFEGLKANMKEKTVDSQLLLLPIDVMLMSEEVGLIDGFRSELEAIGFSFTCLRNTVRVDALPAGIDPGMVPDMFTTFAEQVGQGTGDPKTTRDALFEKALYQASCKAAVKAGREYPPEQMAWVVEQLMKYPDITFCPHGRPVAMEIRKRTLDHQFERC
jgi:DNA mismatch repair protein MutL